jgi:hypothetical protein
MKHVLVKGRAVYVGSHIVRMFVSKYLDYNI